MKSWPISKSRKYRNKPTEYNGLRYDSKAEARRAQELDFLEGAGEIAFWIRQPTFYLGCPENVYRADFLVVHTGNYPKHQGVAHVEDVKGRETPKFKRDRKLWAAYGPCELHIKKCRGSSPWMTGVIVPGGEKP